ncbi:MAG: hypothetical protein HFJ28_03200 [Clostridia bacterium]|nr:hypothetical protein [Clostridia bacterium]
MWKKLLTWILTFAISIVISAIFNLSNQGVVFLVLYLLEYAAAFFFVIGSLFSPDFPAYPLAVVISFLLVAVGAGVGLIVAWIISLFGVNFYVAYEISTFVLCFIPAKVTAHFERS